MDDPKIMNIMNGMKSLEDHCQLISDVKGKWPVKKKKKNFTKCKQKFDPRSSTQNAKPHRKPGKIKRIYVKYYISGG